MAESQESTARTSPSPGAASDGHRIGGAPLGAGKLTRTQGLPRTLREPAAAQAGAPSTTASVASCPSTSSSAWSAVLRTAGAGFCRWAKALARQGSARSTSSRSTRPSQRRTCIGWRLALRCARSGCSFGHSGCSGSAQVSQDLPRSRALRSARNRRSRASPRGTRGGDDALREGSSAGLERRLCLCALGVRRLRPQRAGSVRAHQAAAAELLTAPGRRLAALDYCRENEMPSMVTAVSGASRLSRATPAMFLTSARSAQRPKTE